MYVRRRALARRLQLKAGQQAVVIGAPPGYANELGVEVSTGLAGRPDASAEFIQMFVKSSRGVEDLVPAVLRVLRHDGLLWISYPKGTSKVKTDLNRDILWKAMERFGLAGVSMVSIDGVWSAMRFRPLDRVGR
ncbi:MAG TPA: hypothetical protein VJ565_00600 [Dehalococcoidia bacterium]|nr:hypothetical protein [Dehalococcoidia bacterium]